MIQTMQLRKAYEYLDRAIYWDNKIVDSETAIRYSLKIEMLMNKACQLELSALGFIFYATRFDSPGMGAVTVALPGPIYPDNSMPIPYNHPSRDYHRIPSRYDHFTFPKKPTHMGDQCVLH